MKNIDRLLSEANALLNSVVGIFFPGNDDKFLECLGVDPEEYKRTNSDGTVGYDFLQALSDTAREVWKESED